MNIIKDGDSIKGISGTASEIRDLSETAKSAVGTKSPVYMRDLNFFVTAVSEVSIMEVEKSTLGKPRLRTNYHPEESEAIPGKLLQPIARRMDMKRTGPVAIPMSSVTNDPESEYAFIVSHLAEKYEGRVDSQGVIGRSNIYKVRLRPAWMSLVDLQYDDFFRFYKGPDGSLLVYLGRLFDKMATKPDSHHKQYRSIWVRSFAPNSLRLPHKWCKEKGIKTGSPVLIIYETDKTIRVAHGTELENMTTKEPEKTY